MAVSASVLCSFPLFWLIFSVITVASAQNTTNYTPNTSTAGDWNLTHTVTDNYTEYGSPTSPTPSSGSSLPPLPAEPLPVSGRLLTPETGADRLCPCDEHQHVCDINCCCDRECDEEVRLFTSCSVSVVRSGSRLLCSQDAAHYTLRTTIDGYSELQSSVQKEVNYNILCILSQNRFDGLSHPPPALPTDSNFDSLFKQFATFLWGAESSDQLLPAQVKASPGYQYGDIMMTAEVSGQRGVFYLPAPGVTADCVNNSPAAFLKDQSSRCSRRVDLNQDCSSLPAISTDTYTNIQLLAGKNADAAIVPVRVASVILESVEGPQTELTDGGGENLSPVLLNSSICTNVVLKVIYVIRYNSFGEVVNATVSLVLGFVREAAVRLEQTFQVMYIQEDGGEEAVHYSGNPGYVVGLPLVSGKRVTDGITRSINLRDTLSLLHSAEDQDCLQGPHQRAPVLFGLDFVSGCTLRLEDITNCSLVSQLLLDVLRGPNYPQVISSFGNSPLENPVDWVQIKTNINPTEAQSCSIPLSLHLEIEWTKYGSLVNPQARVVTIREVIQTNTSRLDLLSSSTNILLIRSSVAFIPVSSPAFPGYRATPSIDAKLPFDFFFPFV